MKALLIDDAAGILSPYQRELLAYDHHVVLISVSSATGAKMVLRSPEPFDFIIVDLQLGGENGFDLLAELSHAYPAIPLIALSGSELSADAVRAIYLGAVAFVPRRAGGRGLVAALRAVAAGAIHVSTAVQRHHSTTLTPRQVDVLTLLMRGQSNKTMARSLNLSVDTVKDHVTAVLRNLNVKSRTQAVLAASHVTKWGKGVGRASFQESA